MYIRFNDADEFVEEVKLQIARGTLAYRPPIVRVVIGRRFNPYPALEATLIASALSIERGAALTHDILVLRDRLDCDTNDRKVNEAAKEAAEKLTARLEALGCQVRSGVYEETLEGK